MCDKKNVTEWLRNKYGEERAIEIYKTAKLFISKYQGKQLTTDLHRYFQFEKNWRISIFTTNMLISVLR